MHKSQGVFANCATAVSLKRYAHRVMRAHHLRQRVNDLAKKWLSSLVSV